MRGGATVSEQLVFAFHDKTLYRFERADTHTASAFGGPMVSEVVGVKYGPKPLHMIARLGSLHIPGLGASYLSEIPLIYGMYYSGCDLFYRIEYGHKIELQRLDPSQSMDQWPYSDFPPLLPYVPLRLTDVPRGASYDEFAAMFPNMSDQQPADLVVAVPPPATVGVSLWGIGDGDGVTIVFECDLEAKLVHAHNVTT